MYKLRIVHPETRKFREIHFNTRDAWESYITYEARYTINELRQLYRAITKEEREKAHLDLYKKRLEALKENTVKLVA